jgi:glutamine synthetase
VLFSQTSAMNSLGHSPNAKLDKTILEKYLRLPQPEDKIQATYIWIDGTGEHVRAKDRTITFLPKTPKGEFILFLFI